MGLFYLSFVILIGYATGQWSFIPQPPAGLPIPPPGGVPNPQKLVQSGMSAGVSTVATNPLSKSVIDSVPKGSGVIGQLELQEGSEVICRPGFQGQPFGKYMTRFMSCRQRLEKASNGSSETLECVRLCIWNELNYVTDDNFNAKTFENSDVLMEDFPGEEGSVGAASRKSLADDFAYCFKEHKPKMKYDRSGCTKNLPFTKCYKEQSVKACSGAPASYASLMPANATAVPESPAP